MAPIHLPELDQILLINLNNNFEFSLIIIYQFPIIQYGLREFAIVAKIRIKNANEFNSEFIFSF